MMKTVETGRKVRHLVRITPYRREGASDRGLVVTILDVSALHRAKVLRVNPTSPPNKRFAHPISASE
jgi:hypothetical protein